jgi:hypothetical protein
MVEHLRHDDNLVARDLVLLQEVAEDLLRASIRVGIGNIKGADPSVIGMLENWKGFFLVENLGSPVFIAVRHATNDNLGDFEAGAANSGDLLAVIWVIEVRIWAGYLMYCILVDMVILLKGVACVGSTGVKCVIMIYIYIYIYILNLHENNA